MKMNEPSEQSGPRHPSPWRRSLSSAWREWVKPFLIIGAIVLPLKSAVADWEYVPSGSMMPSIVPVELVLVNKLAYDLKLPFTTQHLAHWGDPQRGDVVVFFSPADNLRLVKRVIGLPGDVISMDQERLSINGTPVSYGPLANNPVALVGGGPQQQTFFANEQLGSRTHPIMILPQRGALRTFGPVRVPAGSYFMMGDNRDNSNDSRFIGCVSRDRIVGRATTILASIDLDHWGQPRFDRFLKKMP
jgi:signal peptidase I